MRWDGYGIVKDDIRRICKMVGICMLNSRQQCIYEWIYDKLQLPAYADVFRGAAILLNQRSPGYVTFVAHAGRDIMNGLARTVRGDKRQQVQYVEHLDKIAKNWNDQWGGSSGFSTSEELSHHDSGSSHHEIPHTVCGMLQKLIDEHKRGRDKREESNDVFFSTFLRYKDKDRIPENFMREWKDAKNWFQKYAHIGKDISGAEMEAQAEKFFTFLESMLHVAASSQYERIGGIDEILDETNR